MQGLGNDFLIFDYRAQIEEVCFSTEEIKRLCNRRYGIGCDQLIVMYSHCNSDCAIKIYNSNGSFGRACGNGVRCVAKIVDKMHSSIAVLTENGDVERILSTLIESDNNISVDMGTYDFIPFAIPISESCINHGCYLNNAGLLELDPQLFWADFFEKYSAFFTYSKMYCVSVGNPHLLCFVKNTEELNSSDIMIDAQRLTQSSCFMDGINASFIEVVDEENIKIRTCERGVGETLACGSAACAAHVVSYHLGFVRKKITALFKGGELRVRVDDGECTVGHIFISGEAQLVFRGEISI